MPPKKKVVKGGKKKKILKKKGDKTCELHPAGQKEILLVKEFFLLQVNDLEVRLRKALKDCEEATDKFAVECGWRCSRW